MAKAKAKGNTNSKAAGGAGGAGGAAGRGGAGGTRGGAGAARGARAGGGGATSRKPGKAAVGKSGVMPEIGAARVEATPALGTRPTATRRPTGKAKAQLPGEKAIPQTDQTIPVEAERTAPGDEEPMPTPAVDHRRQIVGTDDPRRRRTQ